MVVEQETLKRERKEEEEEEEEIKEKPVKEEGLIAFEQDLEELEINKKKEFKSSKLGLPKWLAEPTIVYSEENQPLEDLKLLNKKLIEKCQNINITHLFAVQSAVLPLLVQSDLKSSRYLPGDLCVSAPTGSGKTLAYVLPIIQNLMRRTVIRLRALILLPTHDLVAQVRETLAYFCSGTDLKVVGLYKKSTFEGEQQALVGELSEDILGGSSKVDILIATPGRLMDHLSQTKNFSFQHLRYLIIDEADRMLNQNFYEWLNRVLNAIETQPIEYTKRDIPNQNNCEYPKLIHDAVNPLSLAKDNQLFEFSKCLPQVQKLLFSATLTRNPGKINSLKLKQPQYIVIKEQEQENIRYTTPKLLQEKYIVYKRTFKPLLIVYLINMFKFDSLLIFTNSIQSTIRLHQFINLYIKNLSEDTEYDYLKNIKVESYHSELERKTKISYQKQFKNKQIQVLICSDLMARGIDVDNVQAVINYDAPNFIKQYIHRVGRTARANQKGLAVTLLDPQEATPFRLMQTKANRFKLFKPIKVTSELLKPWKIGYEETLKRLEDLQ